MVVFSAVVRGFHVYRESKIPNGTRKLCCLFEENNVFDMFAIKIYKLVVEQLWVTWLFFEQIRIGDKMLKNVEKELFILFR